MFYGGQGSAEKSPSIELRYKENGKLLTSGKPDSILVGLSPLDSYRLLRGLASFRKRVLENEG